MGWKLIVLMKTGAFYTHITAEGVDEGLNGLSGGGVPPRFLIIDDGWQEIGGEARDSTCVVQEGAQFVHRLMGIKENAKFQKSGTREQVSGLKLVVDEVKQKHQAQARKMTLRKILE